MKLYDKLLENKLQSIMNEISTMELDLRCCGNCLNFVNNHCIRNIQNKYSSEQAFRYCNNWMCDRLKNNERIIEVIEYK